MNLTAFKLQHLEEKFQRSLTSSASCSCQWRLVCIRLGAPPSPPDWFHLQQRQWLNCLIMIQTHRFCKRREVFVIHILLMCNSNNTHTHIFIELKVSLVHIWKNQFTSNYQKLFLTSWELGWMHTFLPSAYLKWTCNAFPYFLSYISKLLHFRYFKKWASFT